MKYVIIFIGLVFIIVLINCKKNEETVQFPKVVTYNVKNLTESSATLNGNLSSSGSNKPIDIIIGFTWNTSGSPTINDNKINVGYVLGDFSYNITNLTPNTTYFYRTFATNLAGTAYGDEKSFSTLAIPILRSDTSTNITDSTATISGTIIHNGGNEVISAGICWKVDTFFYNRSQITLDISDNVLTAPLGATAFSFNLKGLHAYNSYLYCTYITTNKGTFYAKWNYFKTKFNKGNSSFVWDADGRAYGTITVKDKVWMIETLKTKHYANKDSISLVNDILTWPDLKIGAYRIPGGTDESWIYTEKEYNYYAIIDSRNICPVGWHVSTEKDWQDLVDYFGGYRVAGSAVDDFMRLLNPLVNLWTISEDKTSAGTAIFDRFNTKISIEKSPKYLSMSVMCVKD